MSGPLVSTLVLGLAWLAAVNIAASLAASCAAPLVLRTRAGRRVEVLLALRLFPAAASLFFAGAVFIPAHWRLEPSNAEETFGLVLYALAALGVASLLRSAARLVAVARAGWRLRACRRLQSVDPALGVYAVQGLGGVSLAGVFRTKILVGAPVLRALTDAELDVALAHERAHRTALDNVKRFAMFCAPDLFGGGSASRAVEARWRATAEWAADARAVDGDVARAVQLASALVKVSRIASAPSPFVTSPAWSTLHDAPLLEMRVRRLVAGDALVAAPPPRRRASGASLATIAGAVLLLAGAQASPSVHHLTELLVRLLP